MSSYLVYYVLWVDFYMKLKSLEVRLYIIYYFSQLKKKRKLMHSVFLL